MTRRRLLCGLLLASAVLACFAGWLWIWTGSRDMRKRFEQVKEGMSREEIIRTVGHPPGDYSGGHSIIGTPSLASNPDLIWFTDDAWLVVGLEEDGTAASVRVLNVTPESPTLTERIRRWLGL
jgi:hypothetical protein